jgi:hypothetical protein
MSVSLRSEWTVDMRRARGVPGDAWFVGAALLAVRGVSFHYTAALLKFRIVDLPAGRGLICMSLVLLGPWRWLKVH